MELDDFKNKKAEGNGSSVDNFLESFRKEIKKQRSAAFLIITILISLSVIYLSIFNRSDGLTRLGYILTSVGFISGAIYIFLRYKPFPDAFYTLPVKSFIDEAEKRLVYMNVFDWLIVIPLLLILGTGGGIIFVERLSNYTDNSILLIIIWVVFFIALSVFGTWASRKNWKKEHDSMLNELESFKKTMQGD